MLVAQYVPSMIGLHTSSAIPGPGNTSANMTRNNGMTLDDRQGIRRSPLLFDLCHDIDGSAPWIIEAFLDEGIGLPF